jgi:murein L,D-transpeptidase YcbB/YkuD
LLLREALSRRELAQALREIGGREQRQLNVAAALRPPARLALVQTALRDVLQLRVRGLGQLARAVAASARDPRAARRQAAAAMRRLLASDVIWQQYVQQPLREELARQQLKDLTVPPSRLLTSEPLRSGEALQVALARAGGVSAPAASLRLGMGGSPVAAWQAQLNRWLRTVNQQPVQADGIYGAATASATRLFQQARGIPATGVANPATRDALDRALQARGTNAR